MPCLGLSCLVWFQFNLLDFDEAFGAVVKKLAHQDISALVADIDDDDGVIDYDEYRYFAVLMMQAFRARNFAKVGSQGGHATAALCHIYPSYTL